MNVGQIVEDYVSGKEPADVTAERRLETGWMVKRVEGLLMWVPPRGAGYKHVPTIPVEYDERHVIAHLLTSI